MKRKNLWLVGLAATLGISTVTLLGVMQEVAPETKTTPEQQIRVDCRLVRGDELARMLGFDQTVGDRESVYAIGYVFNEAEETAASVHVRLVTRSKAYSGACEARVSVVPPGGRVGRPFIVRMPAPLREEGVNLSSEKPVPEVLEVRRK